MLFFLPSSSTCTVLTVRADIRVLLTYWTSSNSQKGRQDGWKCNDATLAMRRCLDLHRSVLKSGFIGLGGWEERMERGQGQREGHVLLLLSTSHFYDRMIHSIRLELPSWCPFNVFLSTPFLLYQVGHFFFREEASEGGLILINSLE